jgi:hypothetical protein
VIDKYFNATYNSKTYNCAHFVCQVWADMFGPKMGEILEGFLCSKKDRRLIKKDLSQVTFIEKPDRTCIVLMQRPKASTHVGIWIDNKVLHITEKGVQLQPLDVASFGFKRIRFFTC